MARKDDLDLVAATMRRARRVQGVLAVVAFAATTLWFVLWWEVGRRRPEPWLAPLMLLLCAACGLISAWFVAQFRLRLPVETAPAYALLRDEPGSVRWMFPRTTYLRLGSFRIGIERVMLVLTDRGTAHEIHGIRNEALGQFEKAVRRLAPRADYGLSEKNRKRYEAETGVIVR